MKRTYQPKKVKTLRKFGFLARNSSKGGKRVLKNRKKKGRKFLTASDRFKFLRKKPKKRIR